MKQNLVVALLPGLAASSALSSLLDSHSSRCQLIAEKHAMEFAYEASMATVDDRSFSGHRSFTDRKKDLIDELRMLTGEMFWYEDYARVTSAIKHNEAAGEATFEHLSFIPETFFEASARLRAHTKVEPEQQSASAWDSLILITRELELESPEIMTQLAKKLFESRQPLIVLNDGQVQLEEKQSEDNIDEYLSGPREFARSRRSDLLKKLTELFEKLDPNELETLLDEAIGTFAYDELLLAQKTMMDLMIDEIRSLVKRECATDRICARKMLSGLNLEKLKRLMVLPDSADMANFKRKWNAITTPSLVVSVEDLSNIVADLYEDSVARIADQLFTMRKELLIVDEEKIELTEGESVNSSNYLNTFENLLSNQITMAFILKRMREKFPGFDTKALRAAAQEKAHDFALYQLAKADVRAMDKFMEYVKAEALLYNIFNLRSTSELNNLLIKGNLGCADLESMLIVDSEESKQLVLEKCARMVTNLIAALNQPARRKQPRSDEYSAADRQIRRIPGTRENNSVPGDGMQDRTRGKRSRDRSAQTEMDDSEFKKSRTVGAEPVADEGSWPLSIFNNFLQMG
jgi:hypothetical protein